MGSKRERKQVPPTKIVIRKLPTNFTEEEFKNAISPIPENNYFSFVPGDRGLGIHAFSKAYINFLYPEDILSFRDRFDGYVFVDQKGNEFPALVEYAPFQKIPKSSHNKKDIRCGTIDEDPDYLTFLNLLQNPETVNLPPIETLIEEIENLEKETRANNGVLKIKTPLLEFVEQRNAERFRTGDRKRRKEYDRKKARDEEKRRRKDMIKEYRKRDDYYSRDDREKERMKKREEEKMKWKERKEEREKAMKREKTERYKAEDKFKYKEWSTNDRKHGEDHHSEEVNESKTSVIGKEDRGKITTPRTKRYSEGRKKEEEKKKQREENHDLPEEKKDEEEDKSTEATSVQDKEDVNDEVKEEDVVESKVEEEPRKDIEEEEEEVEEEVQEEEDDDDEDDDKEEEEEIKEERSEEYEDNYKEDGEEKMGKDPRTERRIRNKDRPSMQLYRPGQARLKTRLKTDEGGSERGNDGDSSSSSSASPVMGVSEDKKDKSEPETKVPSKGYMGRGTFERKSHKYRDSRSSYYWDERERGNGNYKEEHEVGRGAGRGGGSRKGYSYHQERENKGKWTSSSANRARETESSQFKSMTFRRSTSQE